MADYASPAERADEADRRDLIRTRRRREFTRTLCEYVSVFATGPTHGDVDHWQARLDELAGQLFDQVSP